MDDELLLDQSSYDDLMDQLKLTFPVNWFVIITSRHLCLTPQALIIIVSVIGLQMSLLLGLFIFLWIAAAMM